MSIERLLLLLAVAALLALAVVIVRAWNARRTRQLATSEPRALFSALGVVPDGRPTVVSFSSPSCAACHQAQTPAVHAVIQRTRGVRHVEVDTAAQPQVARAFGVLTVPSTAILASSGHLVALNQGFAPTARLLGQLQRAS